MEGNPHQAALDKAGLGKKKKSQTFFLSLKKLKNKKVREAPENTKVWMIAMVHS